MFKTLDYLSDRIKFLEEVQRLAFKSGDLNKQIEVTMLICELLDVKIRLTNEIFEPINHETSQN